MDLFCGNEIVFGNTYFAPRHTRVLKISTDAPVRSLITAEVLPSAGSFSTTEGGLQNRFVLWRTDGANLFLDEYSLDRDLLESSLCINFSQSLVIPGTRLFIVRRKILLLIVPTQSGIHRFYNHISRHQDDSLGNYALISRLHECGELHANHDFHPWSINGVAAKAAIATDRDGVTVAAVCMMDGQLLRVVFATPSPLNAENCADETILQGAGTLSRLFSISKSGGIEPKDVALMSDENGNIMLYSVSMDVKIRTFDTQCTTPQSTIELPDLLPQQQHSQPVDIRLKSCTINTDIAVGTELQEVLLVLLQFVNSNQLLVLKQLFGELVCLFSTTLDNVYIVDFACTSAVFAHSCSLTNTVSSRFCLWAIVDESPGVEEQQDQQRQEGQSYRLMKCEFEPSVSAAVLPWEHVRPATSIATGDSLLFKYPDLEAVRNRIFDGNNYAFDIVNRAVQIICNQSKKPQFNYGNWVGLSRYLDEFFSSGQFKQLSMSGMDDDDVFLDYGSLRENSKLRAAYEKFWSNLLKSCNQLQEEHTKPLAIWQSLVPGLVGVIQMCRFTVYCPPDAKLRSICDPHNNLTRDLFDLMNPSMEIVKGSNRNLETVNNYSTELNRLIDDFVVKCSPKPRAKLFRGNSQLLNSNFTVSLISMALRTRIIARLHLAWMLNELIEKMPQILAIFTEARMNPKLDTAIAEHHCRITQMITYYITMWIALSVRLVSQDPTPKQINVAQAFLKYGRSDMVKQLSGDEKAGEVNADGRRDEASDDEEESFMRDSDDEESDRDDHLYEEEVIAEEQSGVAPPSRWDTPKVEQKRTKEVLRESHFTRFVNEMLDGAIWTLWPESSLTLPRFLAESKFFDALKSYCTLNEPFPAELSYAFRFFQAIALSGQGNPDAAWRIFDEEMVQGVVEQDDALNVLLLCMYPSPSTELTTTLSLALCNNQKSKTKKTTKASSLVEYYNKVMLVYKEHKHAEYVVKAGEKAVQFARQSYSANTLEPEALALLLSEIYTTLFTQHLLAGNYPEAVRTVLASTNPNRQAVCLRQLVTHLLDTRQTRILVALPYDRLASDVEDILEARCKSEMIGAGTGTPMYDIAYAFYISRCEYGQAAKLMYDLAMRFRQEIQTRMLLQRRCNALATVYQTMQIAELCEEPITLDIEYESDATNEEFKHSADVVDHDFAMIDLQGQEQQPSSSVNGTRRQQIELTKADVARELLKTEARLALLDANPLTVPPLADEEILRESLRFKRYDMAWLLIKEFEMKPYQMLDKVTEQAIRMDYDMDYAEEADVEHGASADEQSRKQSGESDWVMFNRKYIGDSGRNQMPHWRIVISYLDLAMELFPHDPAILRTVAYAFLKFSLKLPTWLEGKYKRVHFGDLLRLLIDYDDLADAFRLLLPQIDEANQHLRQLVASKIRTQPVAGFIPEEDLAMLLPYTHIVELMHLAEKSGDRNLPINETVEKLKQFNNYKRTLTLRPTIIS